MLDVIENPDVAQALRQDKNQNLNYLKDNYGVRHFLCWGAHPDLILADVGANHRTL